MKLMSRLLVLLAALTIGAALLAGCGGTSKAEYEEQVTKIGAKVEKDLNKLDEGDPTGADLTAATKSLDSAVAELGKVEAPSEVSKLHGELIDTLRDTSELLGRMGPLMEQATADPSKLDADDLELIGTITTDFGKIEKRMDKVNAGFQAKQYDVGLDRS
jgi:outer membrane murein-binding lipoprotein Lpp